jgi:hypothetical protein
VNFPSTNEVNPSNGKYVSIEEVPVRFVYCELLEEVLYLPVFGGFG